MEKLTDHQLKDDNYLHKRLCDYGCGQEGTFLQTSGKWCCEKHYSQCPINREKNRKGNTGRIMSKESREKIRKKSIGRTHTAETREKISKINKGRKHSKESIEKIKLKITGRKHTDESKRKMSIKNKGKKLSDETKEKISKKMKGKKLTDETKRKISEKGKGRKHTDEAKEKIRLSKLGEKNPFYGKHYTEESKEKISRSCKKAGCGTYLKGTTLTKDHKEKISNSVMGEKNGFYGKHHTEETIEKLRRNSIESFDNQEFVKKYKEGMESVHESPNKAEIYILDIPNNLFPNEYEFVGNYVLWIGGKNPDFINKSKNKIIEHFGVRWHSKEITGTDTKTHEKERVDHFKSYGYDTLVIWEDELKNIDDLKEKLKLFHYRMENN